MQNTVSLEVAQELHDIGWRKHCNFLVYTSIEQNGNKIVCMEDKFALSAMALGDIKDGGAGLWLPQLHEILEVLPYMISIGTANIFFKMEIFEDDYRIGYYKFGEYPRGEQISKNPHDAAAQLLIWCVKNNYVTL